MTRRLLGLAKIGVSFALVVWVASSILTHGGVDALGARMAALDGAWVLVAIGLQLGAVALGVARWRCLLAHEGLSLPIAWLARTYLVGRFVGAFTPSTAGLDVYRAVEVALLTRERAIAARVVVVEKLFGLIALATLALLVVASGASPVLDGAASWIAAATLAGSIALLVIVSRPALLALAARFVPARARARIEPILAALAARPLGAPISFASFALALASHLATAAVFAAAAFALGLRVDFATGLVAGVAIVIATLLPISIGGVGVREGVAVVVLGAAGVAAPDATLVAVLGYLSAQPPALLGGLLTLLPRRGHPHPAAGVSEHQKREPGTLPAPV